MSTDLNCYGGSSRLRGVRDWTNTNQTRADCLHPTEHHLDRMAEMAALKHLEPPTAGSPCTSSVVRPGGNTARRAGGLWCNGSVGALFQEARDWMRSPLRAHPINRRR
jgi:hypothetical protein